MSAFDASTKIKREVSDPLSDHKLPHPKSLSWTGITAPTAVKGTKGAHCDLVHGDQWNEINGNHNENILRNQTLKVVGKHKETLVESCYQNIIGPHIVLNNNVRNETRLGVFTKTYGENWTHEHDWGNVSQMDRNYQNIIALQLANTTTNIESQGVHIEGVGVHGEAVLCHGEIKLFHAEENLIHFSDDAIFSNQDKPLDNRFKEVYNTVDLVSNRVKGVESQTKAVENKVSAVSSRTHSLEYVTRGMGNFLGLVHMYEGAEVHTGPAAFASIASPMIFP
jgi:hypothetical protein